MSFYKLTGLFRKDVLLCLYLRFLKKCSFCLVLIVSFFSFQSLASEIAHSDSKMTEDNRLQLLASCEAFKANPKKSKASACNYYVHGFLAGAWSFSHVKATQQVVRDKESSTWEERAYRYRAGKKGDSSFPKPATYYCSSDDAGTLIIEKLSKDLLSPTKTIQALNAQIYDAIKAICPSDKTETK